MPQNSNHAVRSLVEKVAQRALSWTHALDGQADQEALLSRVLRAMPGMAFRRRGDAELTMEFVGAGCLPLTGFAPSDLIHNRRVAYLALIHPDDREMVLEAVEDAVQRMGAFQVAYRIRRVDGTERQVWEQGCAVMADHGPLVIEGIVTDITGHGALADRLSGSGKLLALLEQSLAGVYVVQGGRFAYVNTRIAEIFGYSVEAILALPSILDLVHPDDRELVATNLRLRIDGDVRDVRYGFRGRTGQAETVDVEVHGRLTFMDGVPCVAGILLDVSERTRAERGERQAERLEALGRLAAGVAHDLNNVLSTIRSTAEVLLVERAEDSALGPDLGAIVAAVEQGATLSRQLTKFGRFRHPADPPTPPSTVLSELVARLGPMLGRRIELRVQVAPDLPHVRRNAADLDDVVMNLVVNAQDAMPDGGVMTVRAAGQTRGSSPASNAGPTHVVIEIADTGVGIPEADRELLFEPFYTTKGERGTGLGLANVWRSVQAADGTVEVDSEVGVGSTFRILLPADGT